MLKNLFKKRNKNDYPVKEIFNINNQDVPTSTVILTETDEIKKLATYFDYLVEHNSEVILRIKLNSSTREERYVFENYTFNLVKKELVVFLNPFYYDNENNLHILSQYRLGKKIINIKSVEFISKEKVYVYYYDEQGKEDNERIMFSFNDQILEEINLHTVNSNSMNSRYRPTPYIPDYQYLETTDPFSYSYRFYLDKNNISIDSDKIIGEKLAFDKYEKQYRIVVLEDNRTTNTIHGKVVVFHNTTEESCLTFDYKIHEKKLILVDFQMGHLANRGLGQTVYRNLEESINRKFGLNKVVGTLSPVDNPNRERRDYFYSKMGFEIIGSTIIKNIDI